MAEILLLQSDGAVPPCLSEAIAQRSDLAVCAPTGPEKVLQRLEADAAGVAAVVVAPGERNPLAWTQRAHAIDRALSIVLVTEPGQVRELRDALSLTPEVGEDVTCLDAGDREALADAVVEAAQRRRQRQAYARVTAAINRGIGEPAAPSAPASDLGQLLDHAPIGVVTIDTQGLICGTNARAAALLDRARGELVGTSLVALFNAPDQDRARAHVREGIQGAEAAPIVVERSQGRDARKCIELRAVAAEVGPNEPGAIALLQDVTAREQARQERDRAQEELLQQRRWFEATVLGIGDALIATDAHGRVTLMNAVAEQLTGWSQADAEGLDSDQVFRIFNESTGEPVESPVARVLRDGTIVGLANHTVLVSRDGERLPIDDSGAPIRDSDGALAGVVLVFRDVSERRRTEEALRHSERRFRAIFDQAAVGIALVTPDGRLAEVNDRFCDLVGYSQDELLAMPDPVTTLTHPDDLATDQAHSRDLVTGEGPSFQLEKRYIRKDGQEIWVRLNASTLRDEEGNIEQLIGAVEDIDERARAEAALQASEERLRLIFESVTDFAIFTLDRERRITNWSHGAERILGYSEAEAIGESGDIVFVEEDCRANVPQREMETALAQGAALDDRWHVRKDGSLFWASGQMNALRDGGDDPLGFVKIMRDQTEAKRAQDQLEARARQQAAVASFGQRALSAETVEELLHDAVAIVARTLDVDYCKVLRLLPGERELELEAGVGWPTGYVGRARVGADRDSQAGYTLLSANPVVVDDLSRETRFSGPPLLRDMEVVSGMSVVITGPDGRSWGVMGAHSRDHRRFSDDDVNFLQAMANILAESIRRNQIDQRLRELNQTLEERVAERTAEAEQRAAQLRALTSELTQTEQRERRRLAQVLHDHLQQMLVAAKLQLGTASKGVAGDHAAGALERVGELLDASIQESRSLTVELSPPVLYEAGLVAGLEWLGRWMQEQHGLTLELHAGEGVDPEEDDLRVLLFQTVRELLFNVVKHAAVDSARVDLRRDEQERIEAVVCDRGSGFTPRPAQRSDDSDEGGGFGLFSIRERLARLGGELRVDSAPGQGTCVTVAVAETAAGAAAAPASAAVPEEPPAAAVERGHEAPRPVARAGVTRVVIADDHVIVREGLVGVLNGQPDIDVVGQAGDGQAAVELVRQERPDVAVLDVTMPRMNGIEAARVISEEFPDIRVIGLSVHETSDMAGAMRNAGAAVYLNKAGPSHHLLAAIRGQAIT